MAGQDELYNLLRQVAAYTHLIGEETFAGTSLTAASGSMLIPVLEQRGLTVAEFSRRIPKTQQTLSQLVARLEKLGLIERRLGPGRGVGLHLTEAGRELATEAVAREQEVNTRLRDLLGAERAAALADLLRETRTVLREPADAGQRARRVDGRRTAAVSSTESGFPAATGCQLRHC